MEGGDGMDTKDLSSILDTSPETLSVIAMATVAALAKAWTAYNTAPQPKRIGRRTTDMDCEHMQASQKRIEQELETITGAVRELADAVRALQAARTPADAT